MCCRVRKRSKFGCRTMVISSYLTLQPKSLIVYVSLYLIPSINTDLLSLVLMQIDPQCALPLVCWFFLSNQKSFSSCKSLMGRSDSFFLCTEVLDSSISQMSMLEHKHLCWRIFVLCVCADPKLRRNRSNRLNLDWNHGEAHWAQALCCVYLRKQWAQVFGSCPVLLQVSSPLIKSFF